MSWWRQSLKETSPNQHLILALYIFSPDSTIPVTFLPSSKVMSSQSYFVWKKIEKKTSETTI